MADETEHTGAAAAADAAGNAGPAPAAGELPPLPATATALAGKAKDLQALRDAVVDAASVGAGLWFSYLFVLFYLLIAVGGVTHRDLFLQNPVKLPFLNVDLPLLGFFVLGPAIFLIVHAYVLLHFVLLAGKVGDFDAELRVQIPDEDVRRRLRRQLPSNIFVQFLAGSREVRTGVMGFMLRLIAQISLVIGPIALLVFFQLQFLPYHDWAITWWHRIAVLADIALLWTLWPSVARGEAGGLRWRDLRRGKIVALVFTSLAPLLLAVTIATFPGERPQNSLPTLRFIPWKDKMEWRLASLYELLVAGEVDLGARKPKSLWSNRLVLPGFDAIDHSKFDSEAKIAALPETVSLRARHLEGAVLISAKLRKADFTGAQLRDALLGYSDLREAKFDCTMGSSLQPCAQLQDASLLDARLQGASFLGARLQGASLILAQLQGASLDAAQLQGASLGGARLQGASLEGAQLQGASLERVQLQGAALDGAQLQGASLDAAQLQGASLGAAQLEGASLEEVFVWRADARQADWKDTRVVNPDTGPKQWSEWNLAKLLAGQIPESKQWSVESFEELKKMIGEEIPEGDKRRDAIERIEHRLDPTKALVGEEDMAKVWEARANSSPGREVYEKRVAKVWQDMGCAAEGAPYVLRALLAGLEVRGISFGAQGPFCAQSPQKSALAAAFLDEEHCAGAHGLSEDEKATLKAIRDRSPPPAPKH